jgi:hypothetical protein
MLGIMKGRSAPIELGPIRPIDVDSATGNRGRGDRWSNVESLGRTPTEVKSFSDGI